MGGLQVRRHQVGCDRGPYSENIQGWAEGVRRGDTISKEAAY
jgi:hypothetical protein